MKRQYAISVLLQKDFKEDSNLRQNFQLVLNYGTIEVEEVEDDDKLKNNALNDFIENNKTGEWI